MLTYLQNFSSYERLNSDSSEESDSYKEESDSYKEESDTFTSGSKLEL